METYYKPSEIADVLKVSKRTVERWIADGKMPSLKICGVMRVSESDFRRFIAMQQTGPVMTAAEHRRASNAARKRMMTMNGEKLFTPDGKIAGR